MDTARAISLLVQPFTISRRTSCSRDLTAAAADVLRRLSLRGRRADQERGADKSDAGNAQHVT
jgi:hypothetical protein